MSAAPAPTERSAPDRSGPDSAFDPGPLESSLSRRLPTRWIGQRLRLLVLLALLGCLAVFALARWHAANPFVEASFTTGADGQMVLVQSPLPALNRLQGRALVSATSNTAALSGPVVALDAALLHESQRWQVKDPLRQRQRLQQAAWSALLAAGPLSLRFDDGQTVQVQPTARGYSGLGLLFWPLVGVALLLYLLSVVVVLARPQLRNGLYAVMALGQAGNLLFVALQSGPGIGGLLEPWANDMPWRLAFDSLGAAAAVHAFSLHPRRLPQMRWLVWGAWALALSFGLLSFSAPPPGLWWWAQAQCVVLGAVALYVIHFSYRLEPNPFALVIQRVAGLALALTLLVTLAVGAAAQGPVVAQRAASAGGAMWALFLAAPLLLAPFVARSRQMLREFAMLAGVSTVAAALDLVFVAVFSLGPFTSFTLAVFVALGVYAAARQWVLNHLTGVSVLTTERTFEQLYRVAREVQVQPARHAALLAQLLRDLFDPLEMLHVPRQTAHARVVASGSALMVPLSSGALTAARRNPATGADNSADKASDKAVVLRFARRGQRLFTDDDARLADRVVEQLRRAVAYDKAVERGRSEERLRIAQDLHDDIGARLLTLMYQAPNLEMEEYIRHTLKDLKTLTRGLAASEHPLSHAAAEWKSDLTQRLAVAQIQLGWQFSSDRDLKLSMVQWSALTRIVRELVSNTLHHAQATRVDVSFHLQGALLQLQVADDGSGRSPELWSHGLGLGGVRKRVKVLGGEVQWFDNVPCGIVCKVRVPNFSQRS